MFAKGGAAFPDLSGDGQVTQRDILMGRGVQFKQDGGRVMTEEEKIQRALENERFRQEMGLDRMPTAEDRARIERMRIEQLSDEERRFLQRERMRGIERYQEGGMVPPMDPAMMAPPMDPAMQEGIAGQLDPAILEPLLAEAATRFGSIDEASDYEDLINRVRGDRAPLEARRDELSMFVGEADAAQTPDSVLAMVQPVIQMSGVDQGIGGLAQQAMDVPVEGPMAEGIMSMAAAPEPMPAAMPMGMDQGMGGPAPVNFNQGGAVRRGDDQPVQYYQQAGAVMTPEQEALLTQAYGAGAQQGAREGYQYGISQIPQVQSLEDIFAERKESYRNLLGGSEEQKNLTQAQMLFDIANLGLGFAGGAGAVRPGMSPAEQLAASAVKLQTLPTISQRAGTQLEQQQKVDFAAMQAAEKAQEGQRASATKLQEQLLENLSKAEVERIKAQDPGKVGALNDYVANIDMVVRGTPVKAGETFTVPNNVADNLSYTYGANSLNKTNAPTAPQSYVTTKEITIGTKTYPANTRLPLTSDAVNAIQAEHGLSSLNKYDEKTEKASTLVQLEADSPLAKQLGTQFVEAIQQGNQFFIQGADEKAFTVPLTTELGGQYYAVSSDKRSDAMIRRENQRAGNAAILFATASKLGKDLPSETQMADYITNNYNSLPSLDQIYDNKTPLQLAEMDKAFNSVDFRTTLDIAKSVKQGTGFFNQLGARISTLGGAIGVDFLQNMGKTAAEAKAELQLVQTLGAAALADSPRFAVTDVNLKRLLFTDPDKFIQDPEKELLKMQNLKGYLEAELVGLGNDLRTARAGTEVKQIKDKISAAKSALSMMSTIKSAPPGSRAKTATGMFRGK
jgi:hypothetical protein